MRVKRGRGISIIISKHTVHAFTKVCWKLASYFSLRLMRLILKLQIMGYIVPTGIPPILITSYSKY